MADRIVSLLIDVTPGGKAYDAAGNEVTGTTSPYIYLGENIQLNLQFIVGAPPSDITQIVKYTGFASSTIACEAAVDNNYTHYTEGALTANKSGSVTSLSLSGLNAAPRARSGTVQLINSAGQFESVDFTAYSVSSGVYTFTVAATLTYSYLTGDTVRVLEPPIISVGNSDIDQTNKATGAFVLSVNGSSTVFESLVKGLPKIPGLSSLSNPAFEFKVYISGVIAFVSVFELKCLNLINFTDVIAPAIESSYYTKTEADSRYIQDAPSDTKLYGRQDGAWTEITTAGDVVGPASATSNNLSSFDGTTGKQIKDSGISATAVSGHIASTSNPHSVTAAQVGKDTAQWNADKLQGVFISGTAPTTNQVLSYDGSNWVPATVSGTGDVVGVASSTDNAIARFNGTTGKAIQNSSVTVDDNGSINIPSGQAYKVNNVEIIPTVYTGEGSSFVTVKSTEDGLEFSDKDTARMKVAADVVPNGIEDATKLTLSYNKTTRVLTLTYASGFAYWCQGVRYTPTGTYAFTAHANTTGTYFFFWNSTNTPTVSTTPWSILTDTQIAYVYYNATSGNALLYTEKHPSNTYTSQGMSSAMHEYLHKQFGAQIASTTGILSGYTLNTAGTVALQYAISQAVHVDEDLVNILPAVVSTGTKRVQYRLGLDASNDWRWNDTTTTGILDNGTDLYYNQNNSGTWQLTPITTNSTWVNYWIVAKPSRTLDDSAWDYPLCAIMGQRTHGTLALAQAEDPSTAIAWGTVYPQEFVIVTRVTYRRVSGSSPSNAQIAEVAIVRSNRTTSVSGLSPTNHSLLTNRTDADSHPASAITNTPSGNIASTNVQTALNELDSEKVALAGDETIAGVKNFSSSPIVPTPTTDYQAATKKYVDDNSGGGSMAGYPAAASLTTSDTGKILTASAVYDLNTRLQLHLDTNFADSSYYNLSPSVTGSAAISSTQSKFGGSSAYFPAYTDYVEYTIPTIGTGDFSIEFWAYHANNPGGYLELGNYSDGNGILLHRTSLHLNGGSGISFTAASNGTWNHFRINRSGTSVQIFANGIIVGSGTSSANITRTDLRIGAVRYASDYGVQGYIDEFRFSNISRGTSEFTPPTIAYVDITKDFQLIQPDLSICQGRLTLESGVAVSTTDQTAKTTLYWTPYNGNQIALYNGSAWILRSFTETSLSLSGYTADTNYDIWGYDNAGTLALDSTAWTNATTRATALTLQNGVYVKSGDATRRYLGTIRTTATAGQCEDSQTKRFVWNYYNQVEAPVKKQESTSSWTYSSTTVRYLNNSSSNKIELVQGLASKVKLDLYGFCQRVNTTGEIAFGVDSSTTMSADGGTFGSTLSTYYGMNFELNRYLSSGYHYIAILEHALTNDTVTFMGTGGTGFSAQTTGIIGTINY